MAGMTWTTCESFHFLHPGGEERLHPLIFEYLLKDDHQKSVVKIPNLKSNNSKDRPRKLLRATKGKKDRKALVERKEEYPAPLRL